MADVKQLLTTARATESPEGKEKGETVKNGGAAAGKRNIAQLAAEKIEPYVRKRRCSGSSSERSRKRTEHLNEEEQNILRLHINSRERKRMHDMNDSLDELRKVLPFTENERLGAKKMSKIDTILWAKMCILRLTKEIAQLRANNERLFLENLTLKRNRPNAKEAQQTAQGTASVADSASTSSQRNAPHSAAADPCRNIPAVANVSGLLPVPPCQISSGGANSILPQFVPLTAPMFSTNAAAFLMQEKTNQILGNAFAVQQILAMKSANDLRQGNGGIDLFGHLPTAHFHANYQTDQSHENGGTHKTTTAHSTPSHRKRKPNSGRKEEEKRGNDRTDQRKSLDGSDQHATNDRINTQAN